MNTKMKWLTIILAGLLTGVAAAPLIEYFIPTNGNINAVGDFDYTIDGAPNPTTLDWGAMDPGATYLVELSITNTGNTDLTIIITANLPQGWTHSWAYNNTVFQHGASKIADYELTPAADALAGMYTWTTNITATEAP